jgi:hypothetical protein
VEDGNQALTWDQPNSRTSVGEWRRLSGAAWRLFYEVKANLSHQQLELLARAGVRWVQPGIESLHTEVLRLMDKGVAGWQNIQLLKWTAELVHDAELNDLAYFFTTDPSRRTLDTFNRNADGSLGSGVSAVVDATEKWLSLDPPTILA